MTVNQDRNYLVQCIVPVYNEGENVRVLYNNLLDLNVAFDILSFVYDFDEDTTLPVIASIATNDSRVRATKNLYGRGVLNALKWGFAQAEHGPCIVMMGDNSDKLSIIANMIELWKAGAVIVSPSRYMKGGIQHGGPFFKGLLSRLAGTSLNMLGFPTADPTNSFKLYDGTWLKSQHIESTGGFEVAIELCYKAFKDKKQIKELPTEWFDRTQGQSRFKLLQWLPHYWRWYWKIVKLLLNRK